MRRLTIERTAAIILFILLFALAARVPTDTDAWWHIRTGEYILTHGMIYTDPFSFTMQGEPWIDHSWLAQVVLYLVWQVAGNVGLTLFMAGLATLGMFFVYRASEGNAYLRAFAVVLGASTAAVFWSPRPQMFSFALSAVVYYLLYLYRRKGVDRLWLIPALMIPWVNLHAGFSIGFILLLGTIAGESLANLFNRGGPPAVPWSGVRKLVLITGLSVVALLLNPYGARILPVPIETLSIGALRDYIQEWRTPDFHQVHTWPFIALTLAVLGAVGASRRRLSWTDFLLFGASFFLSLFGGRNIALFAVVATPLLTHHLNALLEERGWVLPVTRFASPRQVRLNVVLIALVLIGSVAKVVLIFEPRALAEAQSSAFPVAATEYLLRERLPGPLFNSYNWGGYLMFRAPEYPVFIDGRTDLYRDEFMSEFLRAALGESGWRETLDRYDINLVFVEPGSGLARLLRQQPDWSVDYEDDVAVIFARAQGGDSGGDAD